MFLSNWKRTVGCGCAILVLVMQPNVMAQTAATAPATAAATADASGTTSSAAVSEYIVPSTDGLTMPPLEFTPTPLDEADYDKYFYFHRDGTTFAEAYADIKECDALASGSSIYLGASQAAVNGAMMQYGALAGGIGGALGSALADAIFGSAERRKQRRVNLRTCMGYKQYQRYGLNHDLWEAFNFEEGNGRKKEGRRNDALALQALVASGPKPKTKELGL